MTTPTHGRLTVLDWFLLLVCAEKIVQHGVLALLFAVFISGIGHPDLGERFAVSSDIMAGLNGLYAALFVLAFALLLRRRRGRLVVLSLLAGADIVLEFVFHGPGFITVSVIVSALGLVLAAIAGRRERHPA